VYDGSAYNTLDHPDGFGGIPYGNTYAYDINNSGQVTGTFYNGTGNHGFVYNGGTYITLNAPDAQTDMSGYGGTHATGVNDSGLVTGYFYSNFNGHGPSNHGYSYDGTTYNIIDVPGVSNNYSDEGTIASGINNRGQVAGTFQNATGYHGFVATPSAVPTPSTIWLFGSAITGMIGFVRRKPKAGSTLRVVKPDLLGRL